VEAKRKETSQKFLSSEQKRNPAPLLYVLILNENSCFSAYSNWSIVGSFLYPGLEKKRERRSVPFFLSIVLQAMLRGKRDNSQILSVLVMFL
jgi:hypothetical protein